MNNKLDLLYKNQSLIYKYFLYGLAIFLIVLFFPKGGQFKYEFQKGKPWQHETLYAPFDFSVLKDAEEIKQEREQIVKNQLSYFTYSDSIQEKVYSNFNSKYLLIRSDSTLNIRDTLFFKQNAKRILDDIYQRGVVRNSDLNSSTEEINIVKENRVSILAVNDIFKLQDIFGYVQEQVLDSGQEQDGDAYQNLFLELVVPNIFINKELTQKEINDKLSKVSATRGFVDQGKLIIARGEVVEGENFKVLNSLKAEYESELWTENNYRFILIGYIILVALVLMMLMLFLIKYRPKIYNDNAKVTFIYFNIILMVFVTTFMVKYQLAYLFVVPLCILPLILKTFFDARLGLYVHVLTVLILGFVVPNSFEYIFLQIIAGIVTILSVSELYKRANLFISVAQITGIYILGYLAFHTIHEGNFQNIELMAIGLFILNGMITLFAQPLVYLYEKIFGLVSEVSLLELSDTNSKLLRELSNKAPGTFNHSLQVANLAEAAASEVGANAMLVRVGALYHDIGKMLNPMYFSENQISSVNPHDELEPRDSAKIIIDHVYDGIELAKKNKLPDRLIDFIRTHHGTTQVYYFYKKALDLDESTSKEAFTYPGPLPFSKETAILMMSDSVEAASKSLKNPNYEEIDQFVDRIIDFQMKANQFANANITFKDIESIKKVLKKKLTNIYHLRVEYPE